jgi:hypothetical protein
MNQYWMRVLYGDGVWCHILFYSVGSSQRARLFCQSTSEHELAHYFVEYFT